MKYEFIEHTADIAIKAYGESVEESFGNAAKGMFDVISDISKVEPVGEYEISVKSDNLENLLVDWLGELLFLHETQELLFSEFDVKIENFSLMAKAKGEAINREKHELRNDVKAITYHMLEVNEKEGYVKLLLDI
ncbi:MAG: archease [Methanobacteriota archaeon]|nr:MAG: archease [Euryarchaeota archaeon]